MKKILHNLLKGFHKFIQSLRFLYSFNEKVIKIDYRSNPLRIYTSNNKVYKAKKMISSLPRGVLKAKIVDLQPYFPNKCLKIIDKLGI